MADLSTSQVFRDKLTPNIEDLNENGTVSTLKINFPNKVCRTFFEFGRNFVDMSLLRPSYT